MKSIASILQAFLDDQEQRLAPDSFEGYENVILSYKSYLNNYGFNALSLSEEKSYMAGKIVSRSGSQEFCEVYGSDLLAAIGFGEYLGYYIPRKVLTSKSGLKNIAKVLRKLAKWLLSQGYFDRNQFEASILTIKNFRESCLTDDAEEDFD